MRRRRASTNVSRLISSTPRIRSAGPLIAAHDLDEPFFERFAPALELIQRDAALDEPARQARQSLFIRDAQMYELRFDPNPGAECLQAGEDRGIRSIDAQLHVEK